MEHASETKTPRPDKVAAVTKLTEKFKSASSVFLTDFTGLTVSEISDLRRQLRERNHEYVVVKNTLARRGAKEAGHEALLPYLDGPTALAFSYDDPASPARVITAFIKANNKPALKACMVEGDVMTAEQAQDVALWPSREELLAKLVRLLNAPITGLVMTLNAIPRNLVYALDAIREKKEKA